MVINRQMMDVQANVNVVGILCFCLLPIETETVPTSVQNEKIVLLKDTKKRA